MRALRQCRSRSSERSAERVPHTSKSRDRDVQAHLGRGGTRRRDGEAGLVGARLGEVGVGPVDGARGHREQGVGTAERELHLAERLHDQGSSACRSVAYVAIASG